jgi:serine/threonine protein kinase
MGPIYGRRAPAVKGRPHQRPQLARAPSSPHLPWSVTDLQARLTSALASRYRIERQLGAGGMATVFLAEDLRHHRQIAVKVLRNELSDDIGAERFLNEIEIAAALMHPHILPLHDSGEADGLIYYVMPFVEGPSLRDVLVKEGQLPLDETAKIAREVIGALDYAHRRGVVHRDMKPENVMLYEDVALVADFGIAVAVRSGHGGRMTETGAVIGTPAYMSPKQALGDPVDARSDLYSVACMLYEMLGGTPPFVGDTPMAITAQKLVDPVPPLKALRDEVPEAVEVVLARALAAPADDRYATAAEFGSALETAFFGEAAHAAPRRGAGGAGGAPARAAGPPPREAARPSPFCRSRMRATTRTTRP